MDTDRVGFWHRYNVRVTVRVRMSVRVRFRLTVRVSVRVIVRVRFSVRVTGCTQIEMSFGIDRRLGWGLR